MLQTLIRLTATPTPVPEKGWFEKFIEKGTYSEVEDTDLIGGAVKEWLLAGLMELLKGLFEFISPFVEWGCKTIIVGCALIYLTSHERKYIATGLKWFLIFIVYCFLRGVIR